MLNYNNLSINKDYFKKYYISGPKRYYCTNFTLNIGFYFNFFYLNI